MGKFFIARPIFAIALAAAIVLLGIISIFDLPIEQYPDITPPVVEVSTTYPGADAETVNNAVATPVSQILLAKPQYFVLRTMRAMQERGIRVPQDISMIGFDGLPFSAMSEPTLTTVDVPCADIGRWAVNIIHQQMRGRIRTTCSIHVSTQLHIRKSTAAPRSSGGVWGKE